MQGQAAAVDILSRKLALVQEEKQHLQHQLTISQKQVQRGRSSSSGAVAAGRKDSYRVTDSESRFKQLAEKMARCSEDLAQAEREKQMLTGALAEARKALKASETERFRLHAASQELSHSFRREPAEQGAQQAEQRSSSLEHSLAHCMPTLASLRGELEEAKRECERLAAQLEVSCHTDEVAYLQHVLDEERQRASRQVGELVESHRNRSLEHVETMRGAISLDVHRQQLEDLCKEHQSQIRELRATQSKQLEERAQQHEYRSCKLEAEIRALQEKGCKQQQELWAAERKATALQGSLQREKVVHLDAEQRIVSLEVERRDLEGQMLHARSVTQQWERSSHSRNVESLRSSFSVHADEQHPCMQPPCESSKQVTACDVNSLRSSYSVHIDKQPAHVSRRNSESLHSSCRLQSDEQAAHAPPHAEMDRLDLPNFEHMSASMDLGALSSTCAPCTDTETFPSQSVANLSAAVGVRALLDTSAIHPHTDTELSQLLNARDLEGSVDAEASSSLCLLCPKWQQLGISGSLCPECRQQKAPT